MLSKCGFDSLVDVEELLGIYGKAIPDRPAGPGVLLPPQTPRDALSLLLPLSELHVYLHGLCAALITMSRWL